MRRTAPILIALLLCVNAGVAEPSGSAQASAKAVQKQQSYVKQSDKSVGDNSRGSDTAPLVVKILPSENTQKVSVGPSKHQNDYTSSEWWLVYLTAAICLATALLAFYTALLFGATNKMLRTTMATAERQSREMQESNAAAIRAAQATEEVAKNGAIGAKAAAESVATLKEHGARQLRAYLGVRIGGGIYQERRPGQKGGDLKFEVKPILRNTGNTPASNVRYWAISDIAPFPLPPAFDFRRKDLVGGAILAPGQEIGLNAVRDGDFVSEEEAAAVKEGRGDNRLYIWGEVLYEDVYGITRHTKFCHFIYWAPDPAKPEFHTVMGYYVDRHNQFD